ncbi:MAG TPA: peptide chain release factor 2 [Thermodesulfovibrionia bacterium]|nr:peptide chain release factor 2 [Thermodesulfovibrionia bacterium]
MLIKQDLTAELKDISDRMYVLRGYFDIPVLESRIKDIETRLSSEALWSDQEEMKSLLKKKTKIENTLSPYYVLQEQLDDIHVAAELSEEKGGEELLDGVEDQLDSLRAGIEKMEFQSMMSDKHDKTNAIMTLHPGAGGTESQDWAQMLLRMYIRWAERNGFKAEVVDLLMGDVAGIKSATLTINGEYAYGYLKAEAGVHRLVRISPFDTNKRRHTSFVAVLVYPEIEEDVDVEIDLDDLRIDTYRSSGAGGQHVNKTASAVRITHLPTNVVVACQNERSQHKNKALAMKILKSRLYDLKKKEQDHKLEVLKGEKKDIAWGNQIRSYVLQPYQMVKDHRTGLEIGNIDSVLDGSIDTFIKEYLLSSKSTGAKIGSAL